MTVDDWVYEAVQKGGKSGATVRELQRYIDEHHYEELAIDTIEAALDKLESEGRIETREGRWYPARRTSKADALRALFGDAPVDPPEDEETP